MDDPRNTKSELLEEIVRLRAQVAELQEREAARQASTAASQAAKEYADTLINSSLDMIISVDSERNILEFNSAAEQAFGYHREEVLGQSVNLLYAASVVGQQVHDQLLRDGRFIGEVLNRRKNGEIFPSYLSAARMRNAEGKLLGFMGISRDISERKQLEQQRAEFLAMLTHDIKKPLGAILACAELVLEGVRAQGLTDEEALLERLQGSVTTIDSLVSNYLDFSRIEAGSLALVKMVFPIDRVLQRVRHQYEAEARQRQVCLEIEPTSKTLLVEGDLLALERVFANLVHNALKFTPTGGTIRVKTLRKQSMVVVAVTDTGIGIAPEDRSLLFEKYRSLPMQRQREGTGLGLAIVKALVEAHNGRVEVDSSPSQGGSCFSVYLPLRAER